MADKIKKRETGRYPTSLFKDQVTVLDAIAIEKGVSRGHLIREVIDLYLKGVKDERD